VQVSLLTPETSEIHIAEGFNPKLVLAGVLLPGVLGDVTI
jgi:hypothetical protein